MGPRDLDQLRRGVEAGLPADDRVGPRVEGDIAQVGGRRLSELPSRLLATGAVAATAAEHPGHADAAQQSDERDGRASAAARRHLVENRRSEGDEGLDQLRAADGQHAPESPAAALADDERLATRAL